MQEVQDLLTTRLLWLQLRFLKILCILRMCWVKDLETMTIRNFSDAHYVKLPLFPRCQKLQHNFYYSGEMFNHLKYVGQLKNVDYFAFNNNTSYWKISHISTCSQITWKNNQLNPIMLVFSLCYDWMKWLNMLNMSSLKKRMKDTTPNISVKWLLDLRADHSILAEQ